jgi:hypothetical protein
MVAPDQFGESGRQLMRRRRRLVVLDVEVMQQLCGGNDPVAVRTPGHRFDHADILSGWRRTRSPKGRRDALNRCPRRSRALTPERGTRHDDRR